MHMLLRVAQGRYLYACIAQFFDERTQTADFYVFVIDA